MKFDFPKPDDFLTNDELKDWLYYKECLLSLEEKYLVKNSNIPKLTDFHILSPKSSLKLL